MLGGLPTAVYPTVSIFDFAEWEMCSIFALNYIIKRFNLFYDYGYSTLAIVIAFCGGAHSGSRFDFPYRHSSCR